MVYAFHDSDLFYQARMCNYCKGGMCFQSDSPVKRGSDIYVMMEEFAPDAIGAEIYEGYLAQVRWCRILPGVDPTQYKIGVKYYRTVIDQFSDNQV